MRRSAPAPGLAPEQLQRALLDELADGLRWVSEQPATVRDPIDALLRDDLERQVASLRRGMFR